MSLSHLPGGQDPAHVSAMVKAGDFRIALKFVEKDSKTISSKYTVFNYAKYKYAISILKYFMNLREQKL